MSTNYNKITEQVVHKSKESARCIVRCPNILNYEKKSNDEASYQEVVPGGVVLPVDSESHELTDEILHYSFKN